MNMSYNTMQLLKRWVTPLRLLMIRHELENRIKHLQQNAIVLFNVPDHNNLGDHAISIGERTFFQDYFPDRQVCEITTKEWSLGGSAQLLRKLPDDALIFFHGGGFLGSLWQWEEDNLCDVVSKLGDRTCIVLPQTLYFSDGVDGQALKDKRISFYASHRNVVFFLRDKRSYDLCRHVLPDNQCYLFPDTTYYMDGHPDSSIHRNGVVFCFRVDQEKTLDDDIKRQVTDVLENFGVPITATDTVIDHNVRPCSRLAAVESKLDQFRHAQLVVTDRLHGLILCAITRTPCLAFNNISKKVQGAYDWVAKDPSLSLVTNGPLDEAMLSRLLAVQPSSDDTPRIRLKPQFDDMAHTIQVLTGARASL